jgi:hypothetical protein
MPIRSEWKDMSQVLSFYVVRPAAQQMASVLDRKAFNVDSPIRNNNLFPRVLLVFFSAWHPESAHDGSRLRFESAFCKMFRVLWLLRFDFLAGKKTSG